MNNALLICRIRPARRKAQAVAVAEALSLLRDLHAVAQSGGPLAEQGGVFWIAIPPDCLDAAIARLPRLGYTYAADTLEPVPEQQPDPKHKRHSDPQLVRWHHRLYRLVRVYEEDARAMRESAPDRRDFLFGTREGELRLVHGYRGDSNPLSRRGLPVYDARMLVNLVWAGEGTRFLDPFAGTGGIVIEALASRCNVVSADIDPALRYGLSHLSAVHQVADARRLPFANEAFDAIATELPFHEEANLIVIEALHEMHRVLKEHGRLALMCGASQVDALRREAATLALEPYLDSPINRKGLDVVVLAWEK